MTFSLLVEKSYTVNDSRFQNFPKKSHNFFTREELQPATEIIPMKRNGERS